jgi:lysozyme family protein
MNTYFNDAYNITHGHEGGYHGGAGVNRSDRGGETFKGIARRKWPLWPGWDKIEKLKRLPGFPETALSDKALDADVRSFYRANFWDPIKLSEIDDRAIALELYDTGVNQGAGTAARYLQEALNLLNRVTKDGPEYGPDLVVDGGVGPATLARFRKISLKDRKKLFNLLNILQGSFYIDLAKKDISQRDFIRGWLTRVELLT